VDQQPAEVERRTLIEQMLRDAEAIDAAEDARFGTDGREADLPAERPACAMAR
jgi:hypothetical protein